MKILVVDDDMELLGLIGFALRQAGYLAISANDGGTALVLFTRHQPDLLSPEVRRADTNGS